MGERVPGGAALGRVGAYGARFGTAIYGEVRVKRSRRHRFATVYSRQDVALLVSVDEMHETLSGPATQKILQRQFYDFGEQRYRRGSRWPKSIVCARVRDTGSSGWSTEVHAPCR